MKQLFEILLERRDYIKFVDFTHSSYSFKFKLIWNRNRIRIMILSGKKRFVNSLDLIKLQINIAGVKRFVERCARILIRLRGIWN